MRLVSGDCERQKMRTWPTIISNGFTALQFLSSDNAGTFWTYSLLKTAMPTLRKLAFHTVALMNEPSVFVDTEFEGECTRMCRQLCNFLEESCTLKNLNLSGLKYQGNPIMIMDPVNGPWGTDNLVTVTHVVTYEQKATVVSFAEWIDKLEFREG